MRFGVLGPLDVQRDSRSIKVDGRRRREILALLLMRVGETVAADELAAQLWDDELPDGWVGTLHAHLSRLRRALGPDEAGGPIRTMPSGYRLEVAPTDVDALEFEALVRRAETLLERSQADDAWRVLERAEGLWRGRPYLDFEALPAFAAEIQRLLELRGTAYEHAGEAALRTGREADAERHLAFAISEYPYRERLHSKYLVALYRRGRQTDALRHYDQIRRCLVDELGIEPGGELRETHARILRQDPELDSTPLTSGDLSPSELPSAITGFVTRPPLVGREPELAAIASLIASDTPLIVIEGEPGAGKSHLAAEAARREHERGAVVLWGTSRSDGTSPYQPVPDVVATHIRGRSLLPNSTDSLSRHQVFGQLEAIVQEISGARRCVIVIDDLQWASDDATLLVHHLVERALPATSILVTVRGHRAGGPSPSEAHLHLLTRASGAHVELRPLGRATIEQIAVRFGRDLSSVELDQIADRTGGNAYFLIEMLSQGVELAESQVLPHSIQAVVDGRVAALSEPTRSLLQAGALTGREFPIEPIAAAAQVDDPAAAVDEAQRCGLVRPGSTAMTVEFTHDIVREGISAAITSPTRSQLHQRIGAALEASADPTHDGLAGSLANHFLRASRLDALRAAHYATMAGDIAFRMAAFEEAAGYFHDALTALAMGAPDDSSRRCELLLCLGESHRARYATTSAQVALRAAGYVAFDLGDQQRLRRAVSGLVWLHEFGQHDEELLALLDHAATIDNIGASLAAVLDIARARAVPSADPDALLDRARSLATSSCDEAVVALVSATSALVRWRPDNAEERSRIGHELLSRSERLHSTDLELEGLRLVAAAALELGDRPTCERTFRRCREVAAGAGRPVFDASFAMVEVCFALLDGRPADAAAHLPTVLNGVSESPNFVAAYACQQFLLSRDLGQLDECEQLAIAALDTPGRDLARAAITLVRSDRRLFSEDPSVCPDPDHHDLRDLANNAPFDWLWLPTLAFLAEAAEPLGERDAGAYLYRLLMPFVDHTAVVAYGVACLGSVHRFAGHAAWAAGDLERARRHLERAARIDEDSGAWSPLARDQIALGRLLTSPEYADAQCGSIGRGHLRRGSELAKELGLEGLVMLGSSARPTD